MLKNINKFSNKIILAIHCTDDSLCFGYRKDNNESDYLYIKKFENDLCNNLIVNFNQFISKEDLQKVKKSSKHWTRKF